MKTKVDDLEVITPERTAARAARMAELDARGPRRTESELQEHALLHFEEEQARGLLAERRRAEAELDALRKRDQQVFIMSGGSLAEFEATWPARKIAHLEAKLRGTQAEAITAEERARMTACTWR
jgi:hypothetical protein